MSVEICAFQLSRINICSTCRALMFAITNPFSSRSISLTLFFQTIHPTIYWGIVNYDKSTIIPFYRWHWRWHDVHVYSLKWALCVLSWPHSFSRWAFPIIDAGQWGHCWFWSKDSFDSSWFPLYVGSYLELSALDSGRVADAIEGILTYFWIVFQITVSRGPVAGSVSPFVSEKEIFGSLSRITR